MTFLGDVERLLLKQERREQRWFVIKVVAFVLLFAAAVICLEGAR